VRELPARREKIRGRGRPKKIWEDCVIDVARRKKTLVDMKRLARDRIAFRQWIEENPTLQGNRDGWIDEEEEEVVVLKH
jgi:hypothetical protein